MCRAEERQGMVGITNVIDRLGMKDKREGSGKDFEPL